MTSSPRHGQTLPLIACGAFLALLVATPAAAQDSGTVSGTVVDSSGQVVPGATVTLTNEATVDARTMPSNERGEFAFRAVPPGSYTVRIELVGFRAIDQRNNIVNASSQINLGRMVLEIGALSEVVTVQSTGTFVETTNSDYSSLLTEKQLAQIQTRGRDVMSLLKLLPGVRAENDINAMGDSLRLERAEHQRHAAGVEPGDGRRPERQRALGHARGSRRPSTSTPSPKSKSC